MDTSTYRTLKNASVSCSEDLHTLLEKQIESVKTKLEQCKSINDFAQEMLMLIERLDLNTVTTDSITLPFSFYNSVYHDIEEYGWSHISAISESLQRITLSLPDPSNRLHDISIQFPSTYPNGIPICQFVLPSKVNIKWKPVNSLSTIITEVSSILQRYNEIWNVATDFDKYCIVIDPANPTFEHAYRRIYLEKQCSLMYTINLEKPHAMGEWRFMGPTSETDRLEQLVNNHLNEWDTNLMPRENIEHLLEIKLPQRTDMNSSEYEVECAICYSYQLEYQGKTLLPDKMCQNEKCGRVFHYSCLLDMMRSNPTTKQSFNTLYGFCPYCQSPITLRTDETYF